MFEFVGDALVGIYDLCKLKRKPTHKVGDMYACQTGDYAGMFFILIEKNNDEFSFLLTPEMKNITITKEKFEFGVENGIIEYVKRVPKYVRRTSQKKFEENRFKEL